MQRYIIDKPYFAILNKIYCLQLLLQLFANSVGKLPVVTDISSPNRLQNPIWNRLSFKIVFAVLPAWAAYLSFIFFPMVYGLIPFYSGFVMGDWTLLLVSYLGWLPGALLFAIGSKISEDE